MTKINHKYIYRINGNDYRVICTICEQEMQLVGTKVILKTKECPKCGNDAFIIQQMCNVEE